MMLSPTPCCCQVVICLRRVQTSLRLLQSFHQLHRRLSNQTTKTRAFEETRDKQAVMVSGSAVLHESIVNVSQRLRSGDLTPSQLLSLSLERIRLTSRLNAFITVTDEEAKNQANNADKRFKDNKPLSPLDGIPVALKDNFNVKGIRCTLASKMMSNFVSPYDATVTRRFKEAGCVIVGKTNMDEYAIGSGNVDSDFGPSVNPWNSGLSFTISSHASDSFNNFDQGQNELLENFHVPGGSSGGSAVAVASGAVFAALGSDTGGSTREPAALTGIVGFKPTYGLISRHGLVPLSHTMDTVGIMTRYVEDASYVFDALRGFDELDSTSSQSQSLVTESFDRNLDLSGLRVGIPDEYFVSFMSDEVISLVTSVADKLSSLGCILSRVSLPHTQYASSCYTVLNRVELASNFSCYDGIEYGHRAKGKEKTIDDNNNNTDNVITLEELYLKTRSEGFGDAVCERIQAGNYFMLKSNYDNYVKPAFIARRKILEDFERVLYSKRNDDNEKGKVDFLLTPMTVGPAKTIKEFKSKDNLELSAKEDIFAQPSNLAGVPAITIPASLSVDGLPLGIQLISAPFTDNFLLSVANQVEKILNFPSLKFISSQRCQVI